MIILNCPDKVFDDIPTNTDKTVCNEIITRSLEHVLEYLSVEHSLPFSTLHITITCENKRTEVTKYTPDALFIELRHIGTHFAPQIYAFQLFALLDGHHRKLVMLQNPDIKHVYGEGFSGKHLIRCMKQITELKWFVNNIHKHNLQIFVDYAKHVAKELVGYVSLDTPNSLPSYDD